MKKSIFLLVSILLYVNTYSQNQKIPFFGKIKLVELCGSRDCRPALGIKAYVHEKDKLYYNGNYNSILGRVFEKSIFSTNRSTIANISRDDVDYFVEHDGLGSIEKKSKSEFDAKITADLIELITNGIELPENLKIKLISMIDNKVAKKTRNEIQFSFKIIQLKIDGQRYDEVLQALNEIEKGNKIVVGISVVTVSANWTSNILKDVINEFELGAGLAKELTAEAKSKYESSKDRILEGKVKEFSFIIGDSFLQK